MHHRISKVEKNESIRLTEKNEVYVVLMIYLMPNPRWVANVLFNQIKFVMSYIVLSQMAVC